MVEWSPPFIEEKQIVEHNPNTNPIFLEDIESPQNG